MKEEILKVSSTDIVIFHVGGVGGYGPVKKVIEMFPERVVIVCFEANPSPKDLLVQKQYLERGVRTIFVPKCVGEIKGQQKFYINKHSASSSIFPPAPDALDEHVPYEHVNTWGENCEVERVVEFDTVTLDELVADGTIPDPDIISMDTQGSELPILRGGPRAVENSLCVVCEVDFRELYQGQSLFPEQQTFLTEQGYHLADLLNSQYWHPGPAAGEGFLTMSEALYFRSLGASVTQFESNPKSLLHKLIKLAAIAYAFRRLSFSSKIVTLALEKFGPEAEVLLGSDENLQAMWDLQQYMQQNHDQYLKNNYFFHRDDWKEHFKKREIQRKLGVIRWHIRKFFK